MVQIDDLKFLDLESNRFKTKRLSIITRNLGTYTYVEGYFTKLQTIWMGRYGG